MGYPLTNTKEKSKEKTRLRTDSILLGCLHRVVHFFTGEKRRAIAEEEGEGLSLAKNFGLISFVTERSILEEEERYRCINPLLGIWTPGGATGEGGKVHTFCGEEHHTRTRPSSLFSLFPMPLLMLNPQKGWGNREREGGK